jgi:DNA polymerase family B
LQAYADEDLLFYDIEVYGQDAFVVFKDINKKLKRVFHNNFFHLRDFIDGKILVGYNNYHYDDKILQYMLDLKTPEQIKWLNDQIIVEKSEVRFIGKKKFRSLDCMQQIDVANPSLKKIMGNFGRMILESSIPFSIETKLTAAQFDEALFYCMNDVDTTIDVYKKRVKSYFQPKISLVEMLGKEDAMKWNTTTISANLLLQKPLPKWAYIRIEEWMLQLVPAEVKELWLEKEAGNVNIQAFNNDIQFGFGGLHGAHRSIKKAEKVKLLDVTSMYPNIILLLNCLGYASAKYRKILEDRIAAKRQKNFTLADALKLILNSVYGNLNNKYSLLYNPKAAASVCMYGQIALYDLCSRISPYCEIININTDGVAFIPEHDGYIAAYKEWENDFKLQLEEKEYDLFLQKDVNNYIAVKPSGNLECKGGDVNRFEEDALFKNNNARILDIALVEKLVNGTDITETLMKHLDQPHLYQYILKAGNTYQGTCNETGELLETKVNRVFAAKNEGCCLYKKRHDNGLVRFADAPMNMHLFNQDCADLENFEKIVDLNHYYQILIKRLERWN